MKQFLPLVRKVATTEELSPDALRGIFRGFQAIQESGLITLPPETLSWMNFYRQSFDNKG
jgi:hypothetical protein